ncbi:MAG: restriction endonuclease [Deltaproteobacteria bacterium]|nr:restriction endonuclease [Deltaproteobacteria bacterium]
MTFTEAAVEVLRLAGKPLHFKDITQMAIEKNLLSHVGKTPDVTMGSRLSAQIAKYPDGPIVRVKSGVYALREWEGGKAKKKKKGAEVEAEPAPVEPVDTEAAEPAAEDDATADQFAALASEIEAAEEEALEKKKAPAARAAEEPVSGVGEAMRGEEEEEPAILDEDERMRHQLAATAGDLFEEEEDDDQPLFGGPEPAPGAAGAQAAEGGGRRRRRRRRRGKGREEGAAPGAPSFAAAVPGVEGEEDEETIGVTIGDERDEQPTRRAIVLERVPAQPGRGGRPQDFRPAGFQPPRGGQANFDLSGSPALEGAEAIDELAGRELSDLILRVLEGVDRNQGPVPFRAIAEAAQRRGRVSGDLNAATSGIAAAVRGDNLRRAAQGQRPRFRVTAGGRVAPTDWVLGSELLRLEQDALLAIDRYRDAARRTLASKLQKDMSGPALIELLLVALERLGFRDIKQVRRAGLPGGESHFCAVHVGAGGEEIRTAIVLRRDGREIGRERVIDLRGSLHHYGPATAGWLITTGQCLSGAREEANAPGTVPITLFDSLAFAKLLEENDVAVLKTTIALPFPDVDLLETLRGI